MSELLLIDVSSYIHRAFHAAAPRLTSTGHHAGALDVTIKMIRNLVNTRKPSHVACVFDIPGPTFRNEIWPEYKANRPPKPEELTTQIDGLRIFIEAMGLNPVSAEEVEADDTMATLAQAATEQGFTCVMGTRDKDLAVMVSDKICLIDKDTVIDTASVVDRYGVQPRQISDFLTLQGDGSDGVKGVKGCGAKRAASLLRQYQTLDAILEASHTISGALGRTIYNSKEAILRDRSLIQLKTDVQIPKDMDHYRRKAMDTDRLLKLFDFYEMEAMAGRLLRHLRAQKNRVINQ